MILTWLSALALAGPPDVSALRAADRAGEAEYAARTWLAEDPADPARWVLLGDALADPSDGESLFREALRIDPDFPPAWEGLGRVYLAAGERSLAIEAFERALAGDPERVGAAVGRAEATGDAAVAEAIRSRFPDDPRTVLLVARLAPSRALEVLVGDAPAVRLARADARLSRGEDATDDLVGLRGAEADRLRRWAGCVAAGTVDGPTYAALADVRRRALVGAPVDPAPLLLASHGCSAAHALVAAVHGSLASWRDAFALAPGDPVLAASLGHALRMAGEREEATSVLALADPTDPDVALDLAEIARSNGDLAGASRILAAAEEASPWAVRLVVARAALTPRARRLDVLLAGFERTHDPSLLELARPLAASEGRTPALAVALGADVPPSSAAPWTDDAALEIVVWGTKESDRRLAELEARLAALGYGKPSPRKDGSRVYYGTGPTITVHADGLVDIAYGEGLPLRDVLPSVGTMTEHDGSGGVTLGVGGRVGGVGGKRQKGKARWALLEGIEPELAAWREALCQEGFEARLVEEIPSALDALWKDGVDLDGGPQLASPADRRAGILDYWATRTCTPEGDAVRALIARYLVREVQASEWPVTAEELVAVNARRACPGALEL